MKLKYGAHLHIPIPHPHPLPLVPLKERSTLDSLGAFILRLLSSTILCLVLNNLLHVATPRKYHVLACFAFDRLASFHHFDEKETRIYQ